MTIPSRLWRSRIGRHSTDPARHAHLGGWVSGDPRLSPVHAGIIQGSEATGLGVSIISCWEVAKKVQLGKLQLDRSVSDWLNTALGYPGIRLVSLTLRIVIESTHLPGDFHRDPADQLIVATARMLEWEGMPT